MPCSMTRDSSVLQGLLGTMRSVEYNLLSICSGKWTSLLTQPQCGKTMLPRAVHWTSLECTEALAPLEQADEICHSRD